MNDTIVAVSTAMGEGAISIIRVSGDNAIDIVGSIFKGKDLCSVNSHTINYGHILYKDEIIDEVLISVMRAPKTYTTEDIIEINTHGSIAVVNKIMEILLLKGCRLAEPGEFTKRAFLNGRIDLSQAESVIDLINAMPKEAVCCPSIMDMLNSKYYITSVPEYDSDANNHKTFDAFSFGPSESFFVFVFIVNIVSHAADDFHFVD